MPQWSNAVDNVRSCQKYISMLSFPPVGFSWCFQFIAGSWQITDKDFVSSLMTRCCSSRIFSAMYSRSVQGFDSPELSNWRKTEKLMIQKNVSLIDHFQDGWLFYATSPKCHRTSIFTLSHIPCYKPLTLFVILDQPSKYVVLFFWLNVQCVKILRKPFWRHVPYSGHCQVGFLKRWWCKYTLLGSMLSFNQCKNPKWRQILHTGPIKQNNKNRNWLSTDGKVTSGIPPVLCLLVLVQAFGSETAAVLLIRLVRLKPLHAAVIGQLFPNSTFRNRSQRPSWTINHYGVKDAGVINPRKPWCRHVFLIFLFIEKDLSIQKKNIGDTINLHRDVECGSAPTQTFHTCWLPQLFMGL